MADFQWSEASEQAAQLIAHGNLTYPEIADSVGVSRTALYYWRQYPEFKARVDETLEEIRADIQRIGIATKVRRVQALNDRWKRMRRVIEDRADSDEMKKVPGGQTGLVVKDVKGIGKGDDFEIVSIYSVDTALLKELREHEKQAAQELGQWADKQEITGANGGPIQNAVVIYLPDNGRDRPDAGDPPTTGTPGDLA